ncbi:RHS repeat domain-containing protein [Epilithonimonas hungarica]|uniref:RHS repeat-associated core domain-containing protein n=1 Tax=Epilithonimonas hungarica TaxID=454006 RepID=A0A1G7TQJ6_9FLAO|nr:RHS repeat-associated core domain-containing protein [Epilithonimonas hungarica]SDG36800.1 RHS repeat-associated core domain-containing protein [Epilithonimonas hungarica]
MRTRALSCAQRASLRCASVKSPLGIDKETCNNTEAQTTYIWDEENRLQAVDTNPSTVEVDGISLYTYDDHGERIVKDVLYQGFITPGPQAPVDHMYSVYPNGLVTMKVYIGTLISSLPTYTKHYYAGTQRISGALGSSEKIGVFNCNWLIIPFGNGGAPINEKDVALQKAQAAVAHGNDILQQLNINGATYGQNGGYTGNCTTDFSGPQENDVFWYHLDHLGSSSFITGKDGEVNQNIEYFPSGETFVENHLNSYNTPYLYNSKELDDETGYYYYGARYYNPRTSLWLGTDALAGYDPIMNSEHYIDGQHNGGVYNSGNLNPYTYCYQNPLVYIDPNGKQVNKIKKYEQQAHNFKSFETNNFRINPNTKTWYFDHTASARNKTIKFMGGVLGFETDSQNTVMAGPVIEKVKNARSVKIAQVELTKLLFKDGKLDKGETQGYWYDIGTIFGKDHKNFARISVMSGIDLMDGNFYDKNTFFQEENVLGSFWASARVSEDGKNIIMTVFDTKTIGSLTDGLLKRDKGSKASKFHSYIWNVPTKDFLIQAYKNSKTK